MHVYAYRPTMNVTTKSVIEKDFDFRCFRIRHLAIKSLVSILVIVKISSLLAAITTKFSRKKGKKSVIFGPSADEKHFSVPQSWLDKNNFWELFCSQNFSLSGHKKWPKLWSWFVYRILQKLPKYTRWLSYVSTD